jgi:hypothetical protein
MEYEKIINFDLYTVAGYIDPLYAVVNHSVYEHVANVFEHHWHSVIALTSFSMN